MTDDESNNEISYDFLHHDSELVITKKVKQEINRTQINRILIYHHQF